MIRYYFWIAKYYFSQFNNKVWELCAEFCENRIIKLHGPIFPLKTNGLFYSYKQIKQLHSKLLNASMNYQVKRDHGYQQEIYVIINSMGEIYCQNKIALTFPKKEDAERTANMLNMNKVVVLDSNNKIVGEQG